MTTQRSAVLLVLGFVVGACGGGSKKPAPEPVVDHEQPAIVAEPAPPPPTVLQRAMAKMEGFERAMCACTTADCAKQVSDEMTEWGHRESQKMNEPIPMTDAEQKRALEIGTHMGECMQKAMTTGQP